MAGDADALREQNAALLERIRQLESAAVAGPSPAAPATAAPEVQQAQPIAAPLGSIPSPPRGLKRSADSSEVDGNAPHDENTSSGPGAAAHPPPPTPQMVELLFATACDFFDESGHSAHTATYSHLATIICNILENPADLRFRRLRLGNPRLARELFHDTGALRFLRHVGFVTDEASVGALRRPEDEAIVFPTNGLAAMQGLRAAAAVVELLKRRDAKVAESQAAFRDFRRTVSYEVRMERLAEARSRGVVVQATIDGLVRNDSGSLIEVCRLLRLIIANIAANPADGRVRRLRHDNRRLREVVFPAQGGVEFLVGVVGFEMQDEGLVLPFDLFPADEPPVELPAGAPAVAPSSTAGSLVVSVAAATGAPAPAPVPPVERHELPQPPRLGAVLQNASAVLLAAAGRAAGKAALESAAARDELMREREREKRAMRVESRQRGPAIVAATAADEDAPVREGGDVTGAAAAAAPRRRVPLAEAMEVLLGRRPR